MNQKEINQENSINNKSFESNETGKFYNKDTKKEEEILKLFCPDIEKINEKVKEQNWEDVEEQSKKLLNDAPSFKELQKIYQSKTDQENDNVDNNNFGEGGYGKENQEKIDDVNQGKMVEENQENMIEESQEKVVEENQENMIEESQDKMFENSEEKMEEENQEKIEDENEEKNGENNEEEEQGEEENGQEEKEIE